MIRTFVSVEVPDSREMDSLRRDLRASGARTSPPEQTHVTLKFIGDLDKRRVPVVSECVRRASAGVGPFELSISGIGAFPDERRPSVVWMGAGPADVLTGLAGRLGDELASEGVPFDPKPFRAHVTVARSRDGHVSPRIFEAYRGTEFTRAECSEIRVMGSVLERSGARHTVLARIPLDGRRI